VNTVINTVRAPVLQLITGLGVGGAERVVMELAGRMTKNGFPVIVVALDGSDSLLAQYMDVDFPIHQLNINKKNPFSILKALFLLILLVHKNNVAVIHAHMFHGLLAGLVCRLARPKVKLIFTSHSFAGFTAIRRWLIKRTKSLRAVDIVFVKGQHEDLNAKYTLVIPNGVAVNLNEQPRQRHMTDKRVFLFVGRLEMPKNPLALIDAFSEMEHKRCELWLAGDGTLRKEIEQRILHLGLAARVKVLGVQNDIPSLLRLADCFVMSSSWEGLPLALLEAGAAGLPVVATPVGAIPGVLADGCGYLTTLAGMPKILDSVIVNNIEAQECGILLRRKIFHYFNNENMLKLHCNIYNCS
jgi:glycosyltransferase involved in cell wall biosynthesis